MKYTILNAGFPIAVATDETQEKAVACFLPNMLIDGLREQAAIQRSQGFEQVAIMQEASAAMLEAMLHVHYGKPKGGVIEREGFHNTLTAGQLSTIRDNNHLVDGIGKAIDPDALKRKLDEEKERFNPGGILKGK